MGVKLIKDMWIASPFRRESALFFEIFSNALETLKNLITGLPVNKLVVEVPEAKRVRIEKTKILGDNGPYLFPNQFDLHLQVGSLGYPQANPML